MMIKWITHSEAETEELGRKIGENAFAGCFIALYGDLGAGKTVLTRGIAKALGCTNVHSPSYTILNISQGRLPVYHFDAYRLESSEEMEAIGGEEYFYGEGVCIVEWPERVAELLPDSRLDITITYRNDAEREIVLEAYSPRYEHILGGHA